MIGSLAENGDNSLADEKAITNQGGLARARTLQHGNGPSNPATAGLEHDAGT